ncbi:MAG: glycosyltransferase family 4 protein [Chitinophagaceae bacterium]|nr:glycosyltransferase family 4 protein [Chitinophagaceae bacterium]
MRVIFQIITSINLGGAENIAFSLADYLNTAEGNFKPVIFELYKTESTYSDNKKKKLTEQGIEFHTLGLKSKYLSLVIAPFTLWYYIRKRKPEIVHSHTDLPDFVLALTVKMFSKARFKIIRTIHNTELWPTHSLLGRITEKSFINDTIIAVSRPALTAYNNLRKNCRLASSENQQVILNGIKNPVSSDFPYSLDRTKINIAFAGRLELQKGADTLLSIITNCSANIKEKIVFHIIGHGTYQGQIVDFCKKNSYCIFHEPVSELASKLSSFDYLIMPSRHEGLVLLSLEASFSKVPVIASDIPGLAETLPPGWPLLAKAQKPDSFIEILEKITGEKYNTAELKAIAFNYVSQNFSFEKMGRSYLSVFQTLNTGTK